MTISPIWQSNPSSYHHLLLSSSGEIAEELLRQLAHLETLLSDLDILLVVALEIIIDDLVQETPLQFDIILPAFLLPYEDLQIQWIRFYHDAEPDRSSKSNSPSLF